jgi:integrase
MTKTEINEENRQLINKYEQFRQSLKKEPRTIESDIFCINKFASYIGDKSLKEVTPEDLQSFFKTITTYSTYNLVGMKVIIFYRWFYNLDGKERPPNMKWYMFIGKKQRKKHKDPNKKKYLVTPEEYQEILNHLRDRYGMWEAIYETLYLSGARIDELYNMKINDVINENGNVKVRLYKSKTIPREVPLSKTPELLLRWIGNHPNRNSPDSPLWVSFSNRNFGGEMNKDSLQTNFYLLRKKLDIKKTLTLHCFRKTKATIMFNKRSKDGGLIYSDKNMADFFGWELSTVALRREEYDLKTTNI